MIDLWAVPMLLTIVYFILRNFAEGSAPWYAGIVLGCTVAMAYIIAQIVWNVRGDGRPAQRADKEFVLSLFECTTLAQTVAHSCDTLEASCAPLTSSDEPTDHSKN